MSRKPWPEWTAEELGKEYGAAAYFECSTDDPEEAKRAATRMAEIEAEWERREQLQKQAGELRASETSVR